MERYGHVVVGAGALGAATAYWLAARSRRPVLVCEQYQLGHDLGASEDHSRIIRHAYHDASYAALTAAAYQAWAHVEAQSRVRLVTRTGGLDLADTSGPAAAVLESMARSLERNGHPYELLNGAELVRRWPQWKVGEQVSAVFQPDGGILDIRKANAVHLALARAHGAVVRALTPVRALEPVGDGVVVRLGADGAEAVHAESVVVCAGSWSPVLLEPLGVDLRLTLSEEQVTYFATSQLAAFAPEAFPVWIFHGEPEFYGFPIYGEVATKAARDLSGRFTTREARSHRPDPAITEQVQRFLAEHLPGALGPVVAERTCLYDLTPDRNFVIDRVPDAPQVAVAVGAGHAAKFAGLIGQILADLMTTGTTPHPIAPFRLDRPALTDPSFPPAFRFGFASPETPGRAAAGPVPEESR